MQALSGCTAGGAVTLDCVPQLFGNIIFWLLTFAGLAAVVFIIFGGIKFITSSGDPKAADGARKTITWAIIGLLLILMSFAIVRFIGQVTGVNCIREFGFSQCSSVKTSGSSPSPTPRDPRQRSGF